jgi:hypothetical protein
MSTAVSIPTDKPEVDDFGIDGNALALVGQCKRAARKAGWTSEQTQAFVKEALSGDYDHVIQTCMKYFEV